MPAFAMSSTMATICAASALTARVGPLVCAMAITTLRCISGAVMRAACKRPSATSLHTACSGSTVYKRSVATRPFCSGSESASIAGASVMWCWRAMASSAVRRPFGAPGRMKGSPFRCSNGTSSPAVSRSPTGPIRWLSTTASSCSVSANVRL